MTLLQTDRLIRIATALGDDAFVVRSFAGTEKISGLFSFDLMLASERADITFEQLAGKNVTVSIGSSDGDQRFFNGIITAFAPGQSATKEGFSKYTATLRPAAWLLTRCVDCRVFQDKSVPEIVRQVLETAGEKGIGARIEFRMALAGSYDPRPICIQFNETDLAFIERLCAAEGIFYFFEHVNGGHTLVFADNPEAHKPHAGGDKQSVPFQNATGGVADQESVCYLQPDNKLMSGKYMARDYNFTIPDVDMTVSCSTQNRQPTSPGFIYEYPGDYTKPSGRAEALAAARIGAEDARMHTFSGRSNCRGFAAGTSFTLKDHPIKTIDNTTYVLTRVRHDARQHWTSGSDEDRYGNQFVCLSRAIAFRPPRNHPKPMIGGSQVAIVTGPKEEEIHTDKYGRVKVRFFWDRRSDQHGDGNMSCWIRVSQAWAG
ncbi:MAG: type VI secretion system tip protein VgrG, partial [Desulfatitalea sp.]|nr:type VI secretion system tip protein VgrG [Desulfatitalea sp.]